MHLINECKNKAIYFDSFRSQLNCIVCSAICDVCSYAVLYGLIWFSRDRERKANWLNCFYQNSNRLNQRHYSEKTFEFLYHSLTTTTTTITIFTIEVYQSQNNYNKNFSYSICIRLNDKLLIHFKCPAQHKLSIPLPDFD